MIKRENQEILSFFKEKNIKVIEDFPEGLITPENVFVKAKEGVYIRVITTGDKDKPISGKTRISSRFMARSLSDRQKFEVDIISPQSGGTHPLRFIYQENTEILTPDPQASENEKLNERILCSAMLHSLKFVGNGSAIQMVTSFREGPPFTSDQGIPVYFERIEYHFVK